VRGRKGPKSTSQERGNIDKVSGGGFSREKKEEQKNFLGKGENF